MKLEAVSGAVHSAYHDLLLKHSDGFRGIRSVAVFPGVCTSEWLLLLLLLLFLLLLAASVSLYCLLGINGK
jgi:hypothetical protein